MMKGTNGFLPSYEERAATAKTADAAGGMKKKKMRHGADVGTREAGNASLGVNSRN